MPVKALDDGSHLSLSKWALQDKNEIRWTVIKAGVVLEMFDHGLVGAVSSLDLTRVSATTWVDS